MILEVSMSEIKLPHGKQNKTQRIFTNLHESLLVLIWEYSIAITFLAILVDTFKICIHPQVLGTDSRSTTCDVLICLFICMRNSRCLFANLHACVWYGKHAKRV